MIFGNFLVSKNHNEPTKSRLIVEKITQSGHPNYEYCYFGHFKHYAYCLKFGHYGINTIWTGKRTSWEVFGHNINMGIIGIMGIM
jgi:hypothetical protein